MRNFSEYSITDAVIARMAETPDPRLKVVMTSLVRHLHDFVRDVELSFAEWEAAIAFLTRTGQTCNAHRQEFILLSDTLGVSMLVDAINHRMPDGATETTVLGPFFVADAPDIALGSDISQGFEGEPLLVTGSVSSAGARPSITRVLASSRRSSASGAYTQPRVMISGPEMTSPVRTSTPTTTTTTPSSASTRRSRSTPWPTSPTTPST